jgi:predicted enzyme related to lactoylglutathione lyase
MAMHKSLTNTIDYVEMPSRDLAATKRFFAELFDWKFEDYGPEYSSFDDGRLAGGFFAAEKTWSAESAGPLIVFYHPELESIRGKVVDLGGKITREIFEFPGGRRLHFQAPGSGEFAVWSDK